MKKYLKLIEKTEQETLIHFMLVNGNEEAIQALIRLVKKFGSSIRMTYSTEYVPEAKVFKLCDLPKGKYLNTFGRNPCKQSAQTFNDILTAEEFQELFYKGGIRNFGLDWWRYQKRAHY